MIESIMSLIFQISKIFPGPFGRHISLLHTLLDTSATDHIDTLIFNNVVSILKNAIEHLENPDIKQMESIQRDLQGMLSKGSQSV
jgi:hypothetical protein